MPGRGDVHGPWHEANLRPRMVLADKVMVGSEVSTFGEDIVDDGDMGRLGLVAPNPPQTALDDLWFPVLGRRVLPVSRG